MASGRSSPLQMELLELRELYGRMKAAFHTGTSAKSRCAPQADLATNMEASSLHTELAEAAACLRADGERAAAVRKELAAAETQAADLQREVWARRALVRQQLGSHVQPRDCEYNMEHARSGPSSCSMRDADHGRGLCHVRGGEGDALVHLPRRRGERRSQSVGHRSAIKGAAMVSPRPPVVGRTFGSRTWDIFDDERPQGSSFASCSRRCEHCCTDEANTAVAVGSSLAVDSFAGDGSSRNRALSLRTLERLCGEVAQFWQHVEAASAARRSALNSGHVQM